MKQQTTYQSSYVLDTELNNAKTLLSNTEGSCRVRLP